MGSNAGDEEDQLTLILTFSYKYRTFLRPAVFFNEFPSNIPSIINCLYCPVSIFNLQSYCTCKK